MSFKTSTVVITGASRGIGRHIALEFARTTRHSLFLIARDASALAAVRNECLEAGCEIAETLVCDLTDEESIRKMEFPRNLPTPGVVVNNAGTFLLKPLQETSLREFHEQWAINTMAPFVLTDLFLDHLRQQERALVVNISSVGALKGQARSGAYSSAKHALLGYTRSLRAELKTTSIAVTALNLGQTMSSSWDGTDVDLDELINPADIGKLIVLLTTLSPRTVVEEIILRPQPGDRSPD